MEMKVVYRSSRLGRFLVQSAGSGEVADQKRLRKKQIPPSRSKNLAKIEWEEERNDWMRGWVMMLVIIESLQYYKPLQRFLVFFLYMGNMQHIPIYNRISSTARWGKFVKNDPLVKMFLIEWELGDFRSRKISMLNNLGIWPNPNRL